MTCLNLPRLLDTCSQVQNFVLSLTYGKLGKFDTLHADNFGQLFIPCLIPQRLCENIFLGL